jgi:glycosyltransferase involved in cell wall biosynthesis
MIADLPAPGESMDGGVQAVSRYLVQELVRLREIELHVITFGAGQKTMQEREYTDYVQHIIPLGGLGTLSGYAEDQKNLNKCLARIRPDIVHSQGAGHQGILAARSGYPAITTIHGIQAKEAGFQSTLKKRLRTHVQSWLARRHCIYNAKHTILISPYVAEHYGGALAGFRYMIPNPVDSRFFEVARREEPNRFLFLGRLYALKGVRELILAVAQLPHSQEIQIVLGGSPADRKYVAELRCLAERRKMSESLQIRGLLTFPEILDELAKCTCLVLPSYQETAPMVVQEAMAAGAPVIASNICGIPYQITDGQTGLLIPPGDIGALAERLESMNSNPEMRQSMSNAARRKAQSEYRADVVARKTLDAYRKVIQQSRIQAGN